MIDYNFYIHDEEHDKIKLYCEDLHNYFEDNYGIKIESVDFDQNYNVVLFMEHLTKKIKSDELEKRLLKEIVHLNDVEIRNMKIVLIFDCKEIELC